MKNRKNIFDLLSLKKKIALNKKHKLCDELSSEGIKNEKHLDKLLNTEPLWELFGHKEVVEKLFHINNHYDIVKQYQPTSVEQLAMILAMIRPGKRYLVGNNWEIIEKEVWTKTEDYFFKRSHAIGYATAICVQLNLMVEQLG